MSEQIPQQPNPDNLDNPKEEKIVIPEGFLVMKEEDIELYKSWTKKKIKIWHELSPDLVILADSSAVPIGFALKEAYIKTYGKDNSPKFYRFDPSMALGIPVDWRMNGAPADLPLGELENKTGGKESALELQTELKKFIGRGKKVIAYDETSKIPGRSPSEDKIVQVMANGVNLRNDITLNFSESSEWGQANRGLYALARTIFGESDVWIDSGQPNRPSKHPDDPSIDYAERTYFNHLRGRYENPVSKRSGPTKNPQKNQKAMEFIHDLKFIGVLAAEEILKE